MLVSPAYGSIKINAEAKLWLPECRRYELKRVQVNAALDDIVAYAEANRVLCSAVRSNSSKLAPAERKCGHALLLHVAVISL